VRSNTIRRAWVGLLGHDSSILIGCADGPITGNITGSCHIREYRIQNDPCRYRCIAHAISNKKGRQKIEGKYYSCRSGRGGWLIQARAGTVLNRTSAEIVFMAHSSLRYWQNALQREIFILIGKNCIGFTLHFPPFLSYICR